MFETMTAAELAALVSPTVAAEVLGEDLAVAVTLDALAQHARKD